MVFPRAFARINRRATNRLAVLVAGRVPGFGIIGHSGRKSGRRYRTPVTVFREDDGFTIALTYGTESDWVKNVIAAGGCELEYRGDVIELRDPRFGHDPEARWAPLGVRQGLRLIDAPYYLRLHPSA